MKRLLLIGCFCLMGWISLANHILIPMDNTQSNHLKAYGVVYHTLKKGLEVQWLLNYRGGSFILPFDADGRTECLLKGVGFEVIPPARLNAKGHQTLPYLQHPFQLQVSHEPPLSSD